jgi:hypothetical protein
MMEHKTKTFDCVEMQHRASLRIYEKIKGMTFEQKVAYWQERSRQFREEQERLTAKRDCPSIDGVLGAAEHPRTAEDLDAQLAEERAIRGDK